MRFVVDEMPHSANCDCPFAEWKPNPPCFEEIGRYVCKNDNKKCDRDVSECRWMIQMPNEAFMKDQEKNVRCKDCKYCEYPKSEKEWCKKGHLHGNAETWFCADGERR